MTDVGRDVLSWNFDDRDPDPNQNNLRRGTFKRGWGDAVKGIEYSCDTLETLTWQNLGWRFGTLLGAESRHTMDDVYDRCVEEGAKVVLRAVTASVR